MRCDWCEKEKDELTSVKNWGVRYSVCKVCYERDSLNQCAICGEEVPEGTITGKCMGCKEDEVVKRERERTAILHGVEVSDVATGGNRTPMSEDHFEKWMTSSDISPLKISNEKRRRIREIWLRVRLATDYGWTEREMEENIQEAVSLVETHTVKMASSQYYFHLDRTGTSSIPFGYREIGREGRVSILRKVTV